MFQCLYLLSWSESLFKTLVNLISTQCLGLCPITPDSFTQTLPPDRQALLLSLENALLWAEVMSSLLWCYPSPFPGGSGAQVWPAFSWRLRPRIIHLWASKGFMVRPKSCCSSCLAPLGCCFIWLLQFSLFILSRVPPWPQKWFTAGAPYLGIHNWNGYSFILSIISTFWLREFEWVSVPCKQTHLEGDGCHMCMLKIGMPSLRRGYFSQIWKLKVLSINALKVHLRHLFKSKDSKDADSRLHPILITKVAL